MTLNTFQQAPLDIVTLHADEYLICIFQQTMGMRSHRKTQGFCVANTMTKERRIRRVFTVKCGYKNLLIKTGKANTFE